MTIPFHLLELAVWPVIFALLTLGRFVSLLLALKVYYFSYFISLRFFFIFFLWFKDVNRESEIELGHSVLSNIFFSIGIILFISSEVIFFVSFFWSYFDSVLVVDCDLGAQWPPVGVLRINPFGVPLLNTLILLSSGVTITWAHFEILSNNIYISVISLIITLVLGVYFLWVQFNEYIEATFRFMSSSYGRIFFLATGFHGFHVILGCILIYFAILRIFLLSSDSNYHYGFEFAAWYWHFVDVVWLFLFIFIYWWGLLCEISYYIFLFLFQFP